MVMPRSRSAFSLSSTQAWEKIREKKKKAFDLLRTIFEGTLAKLSSFLLELLNCTLVDTTTLVNQVTSGGGFARIDVTND